ncbi:MAG: hypothetical protein ABF969_04020 [Sporolactobacillus sp.]
MSVHVYANLIGTWHDLTDDPDAYIGNHHQSPSIWWEEDAELWAPINRERKDTLYQFPYVMIYYRGISYRVFPDQIQVVEK